MSSAQRAGDEGISLLYNLSKEELVKIIVDDAKNCWPMTGSGSSY